MVLARAGSAIMLLPGLGEADAPSVVRAGLAVTLTLVLLPVVYQAMPPEPASFLLFAKMIVAEVITGLWLGWLARVVVLCLPIAGQIISHMVGLSSVLQPDAALGAETTILSRLFSLSIPVLVFSSPLYALPLSALVGSYQLIPPGHVLPIKLGTQEAVTTVATAFSLALQLTSPFLIASITWYTAMALIARLTPRLQIYFVAAPAQIIGGVFLLALIVTVELNVWQTSVATQLSNLPGLH